MTHVSFRRKNLQLLLPMIVGSIWATLSVSVLLVSEIPRLSNGRWLDAHQYVPHSASTFRSLPTMRINTQDDIRLAKKKEKRALGLV